MAQYTRKEVLEEAKRLAEMLANTEEIDRFKELEVKINQNIKVQSLIKKIKALQKQAVNLQAYDKKEALTRVEEELDRMQEELDGIPIVSEFKEIQVTVNDVLQLVSATISREVTNRIIESTGGNVLEGKTGKTLTNISE
ncbi:YlbF family regulator [Oceanobacillus luteolus]|uniref:RicAFT regulatory complex protein RicA family protein n=1 Tax=Oceanobacillus luteolus TaxID=1274358 RepID=A0ABW4HQH9_9BACI|nr:YlbF family regulator [Oceanobacillus luteolus]MCM3738973.1 YlbF family regulator [Oceanobacillus luteolus]